MSNIADLIENYILRQLAAQEDGHVELRRTEIADKISWDQEGKPPYYDVLKEKAAESLDDACYFYIKYQFDHNLLLMPHRWIREAYEDLQNKLGKIH